MADDPAQAMNALINRVHAAMAGSADGVTAAPAVAAGEAADGMVRAELVGGRVETLHVDPRMLRGPLDDLVDAVRTAVNAALDAAPGPDATPMLAELRRVQEDSVRQMSELTTFFTTALSAATPRAGRADRDAAEDAR